MTMAKPKKPKQLTSVELAPVSQESSHNVKALEHLMLMREIPKPDINNTQEVGFACESYFKLCYKNDQKPLVSGLAMILGITRKRLLDILNGKERSDAREIIEEYFGLLEAYDELALKDSKINSIGAIFLAKDNYGYTDGVQIEVVHEEESNEAIAERYKDRAKILKGEAVEATKKDDD